jgi:transcriptional regulator with XRE-family HTH domain
MNRRHYDPERLRKLREAEGLSIRGLAKQLRVNHMSVQRAENGNVSIDTLCLLANYFNVPVTRFIYERPKGIRIGT